MKKNVLKIINLIIIMILILTIFSFTNVYAGTLNTSDIKSGADSFISKATSGNYDSQIAPTIKTLADLMMGIAVIVLIITGLIIAIKTMTDGSYGKAQLKESLTPYVIGCIVIISAWSIWKIAIGILGG